MIEQVDGILYTMSTIEGEFRKGEALTAHTIFLGCIFYQCIDFPVKTTSGRTYGDKLKKHTIKYRNNKTN